MKTKFIAAASFAMLCASLIGGAAVVAPASAQAQKPTVILVVDRNALVSQSAAGKTIPSQAQSIRAAIEKELTAEADKLKKDIESYQKNGSLMSEEVRQKTEKELAARRSRRRSWSRRSRSPCRTPKTRSSMNRPRS
jgi:Skp family chaperone for outer membrane proteins